MLGTTCCITLGALCHKVVHRLAPLGVIGEGGAKCLTAAIINMALIAGMPRGGRVSASSMQVMPRLHTSTLAPYAWDEINSGAIQYLQANNGRQ